MWCLPTLLLLLLLLLRPLLPLVSKCCCGYPGGLHPPCTLHPAPCTQAACTEYGLTSDWVTPKMVEAQFHAAVLASPREGEEEGAEGVGEVVLTKDQFQAPSLQACAHRVQCTAYVPRALRTCTACATSCSTHYTAHALHRQ